MLATGRHTHGAGVDKTGTGHRRQTTVTTLLPADGWDEMRVLQLAAALRNRLRASARRAIVNAAQTRGLVLPTVTDFQR